MLYLGYWRIPGRKDAVRGYIEADTEELAYEALRSRLAYYCRITAIYKAYTQPTKNSVCVNFTFTGSKYDPGDKELFG